MLYSSIYKTQKQRNDSPVITICLAKLHV